ncbi:ParA family protein [Tessaracoccus antarcticus]|uniref:ParA family protein n=1 Tax=Tessaracoccus antarcticus TaxID=2479848 RepID=A0A3M0GAP2_9ACTN|nr:ParA family protein [Tessaracoccus antarcticus]RMB61498.1 ParA family protein [Tessaracoccus antarcticus]
MALFFRKARAKGAEHSPTPPTEKGTSSVSRETGVVLPDGPKRAAFDREDDDWGLGLDDEYGIEVDPSGPPLSLPRPLTPRVFVVANQKGGVGKTTTTVNIAAALAFGGLNVLVVDTDPQGNASTALGVEHGPGTAGTYEVLLDGARISDLVQRSPHTPNLHVLPAAIDLATAELELVNESGRESRMKRALADYIESSAVDYVFLDCPPSLGLLTLNALVAATEIMVPIQCEYYALEGVSQLVRTIDRVKGNLNDSLELSTVVLTMFDSRNNLSREVAREVRTHFAAQTLDVEIPRSVRIAEAPSYGQTVLTYQPKSAGAVAYVKAAEQIATSIKEAGDK